MDVRAIVKATEPQMKKWFKAIRAGELGQELDNDEIKAALARLYDNSEENLR
jgi:hypothetical protein